jgi:hypothetical protein
MTTETPENLTQDPSETGPCPPSRYGIPPNVAQPADRVWANLTLLNPNSSALNRARALQLLNGPQAPP